jgi:transposase InsO family protein
MAASFCVEALNEALARYGQTEIFDTDQGSQFTSFDFTGVLKGVEVTGLDGWPRPVHGQYRNGRSRHAAPRSQPPISQLCEPHIYSRCSRNAFPSRP